MSSPKIKIVVPALVVLCSVAYMIYNNVSDTMVYYLTVSELERTAVEGKRYRVSGPVQDKSIVKERSGRMSFAISDDAGKLLAVSYRGAVPDTFREGVEAIVEGVYRSGRVFEADLLLAKCPTKYESTDGARSESSGYK